MSYSFFTLSKRFNLLVYAHVVSKLNANIRMGSCHCWHGQDRKPLVTMPPMPGALAEAAEKAINKDPGDSEEHMAELLKA